MFVYEKKTKNKQDTSLPNMRPFNSPLGQVNQVCWPGEAVK